MTEKQREARYFKITRWAQNRYLPAHLTVTTHAGDNMDKFMKVSRAAWNRYILRAK